MNNGPPSRDRRSLQDLAKLASSPSLTPLPPLARTSTALPPPGSPPPGAAVDDLDHDSGIVDLKQIAKVDADAAVRAKSTPLASAPLFDEELTPARPSSPAPPTSARSGAASRSGPAVAVPAAPPEKKSPMLWIAGGVAALALIGGYAFLHGSAPADTNAPAVQAAAPLAASPTAAAPAPSAVVAAPPSSGAAPLASAASAPEADPSPADPTAKGGATGHATVRRGSVAKGGAAAGPPAGAGGSTVSALSASMAESTASTPAPPTAAPGSLGDAVQHAVGANGAAPPAAEDTPSSPHYAAGSVPEKPSQGTITSALGAVLPEARACLNPDDPISRAHITFASAGSVSAVSVTGHAAGTPVEGCIKSALLKAKLPPFADASYGATVTIRPN